MRAAQDRADLSYEIRQEADMGGNIKRQLGSGYSEGLYGSRFHRLTSTITQFY